jgi:hypothetical protein
VEGIRFIHVPERFHVMWQTNPIRQQQLVSGYAGISEYHTSGAFLKIRFGIAFDLSLRLYLPFVLFKQDDLLKCAEVRQNICLIIDVK